MMWSWKLRQAFHELTISKHHLANLGFFISLCFLCFTLLLRNETVPYLIGFPPTHVIFWFSENIFICKRRFQDGAEIAARSCDLPWRLHLQKISSCRPFWDLLIKRSSVTSEWFLSLKFSERLACDFRTEIEILCTYKRRWPVKSGNWHATR